MKKFLSFFVLAFSQSLWANTYEISVQDMTARGWVSAAGNREAGSAGNYLVGYAGGSHHYRNFFIFDLSGIPEHETIVAASMVIFNTDYQIPGIGGYQSADSFETYQLFRVDRVSLTGLRQTFSDDIDAFADLADGDALSAPMSFSSTTNGIEVHIPLNATFVAYAQSQIGGEIAFGGAVMTLAEGESVYATLFSGSDLLPESATRLIIQTSPIPEPAVFALLFGVVGLALVVWRRNSAGSEHG